MSYEINGQKYILTIIRKRNKNTYIRVKNNNEIVVTTSFFATNRFLSNLLDENKIKILKMLTKNVKCVQTDTEVYILGLKYDIIIMPKIKNVSFENNKIYVSSKEQLNKHLSKLVKTLFNEHYLKIYNKFEENIPFYNLKVRKMKTRWGVCNKKSKTITLNYNLIHYDIECLEYVIVHELAHLIHFDHSKKFWNLVGKYKDNYKDIKKTLKG